MTKYLAIAFLIAGITILFSCSNEPDNRIADVYFDDGSVLHNAEYSAPRRGTDTIRVKHENEIFALRFSDIKTIEFVVARGGGVTLKIKTKTGVVINDQFHTIFKSTDELRGGDYCGDRRFWFVNKLTGERNVKSYPITNLTHTSTYDRIFCVFEKSETKGISSIVFKDGNKKIEEIKK